MDENMPPPSMRKGCTRSVHPGMKSSLKTPRRASRPNSKLRPVKIKMSSTPVKKPSSLLSQGSTKASSCPTSAMSFLSSSHGQLRRHQRNIGKRQLKAALKHGIRIPSSRRGCSKYCYNGITFIVNDNTKREVTSFATTLDLPWKDISPTQWQRHTWARQQMRTQAKTFCKSHSILLVDMSGSMRNSDVQGSRSRLGAVWYSIAQDFIKNRIDTGNAGEADAISVILMGETAKFHPLLHFVPTDWVTYNAVLKIFKEGSIMPHGHGCYRPALEMAESVLSQYESSSSALMLAIMSDGRPSDSSIYRQSVEKGTKSIMASIASLSSKFGKRLTVCAIGMGSANQFETLKKMTEEAENHESKGLFQVPSMSSSSIAAAISSIATSLTDTQTEMTMQRFVRKMTRENRKMLPIFTEAVDSKDFRVYMGSAVEHKVFDPSDDRNPFKTVPLQHPDARGVAIAKKAFGEGTERFAYQFFEVAADGMTVVGDPLVAKESKFVAEATSNSQEESEKFVRRFCRINHQATKAADAFNAKLDSVKWLDTSTARVAFLPCSMYCVNDPEKGKHALGVERRLFGKFQKWNSNNGWRMTHASRFNPNGLAPIEDEEMPLVSIKEEVPLVAIKEEFEPDVVGSNHTNAIDVDMKNPDENLFATHDDVAQAFSHFSYIFGGRSSLICDLQGIYDRKEKLLQFTDPVIHYHNVLKENKRGQYGRTDRGEKGVHDFLNSHDCNSLCDITTKGFLSIADPGKKMTIHSVLKEAEKLTPEPADPATAIPTEVM